MIAICPNPARSENADFERIEGDWPRRSPSWHFGGLGYVFVFVLALFSAAAATRDRGEQRGQNDESTQP